jgi:hypothetical protein
MRYEQAPVRIEPEWPEYGVHHPSGKNVRLSEVESTIDIFDRSDIRVTLPDGTVIRPWRYAAILGYDDDGNFVGAM